MNGTGDARCRLSGTHMSSSNDSVGEQDGRDGEHGGRSGEAGDGRANAVRRSVQGEGGMGGGNIAGEHGRDRESGGSSTPNSCSLALVCPILLLTAVTIGGGGGLVLVLLLPLLLLHLLPWTPAPKVAPSMLSQSSSNAAATASTSVVAAAASTALFVVLAAVLHPS